MTANLQRLWPPLLFLASLIAACRPAEPPTDGSVDGDSASSADASCERQLANFRDSAASSDGCAILQCEFDRSLSLTVGTGRDGTLEQFRSIEQDGELYLVPGEQGLQHVLVAFRGTGFSNGNQAVLPLVEIRAIHGCNEVGYVRFRLPWRPDPTNVSQLAIEAIRVVVSDDLNRYEYCSILGQPITLVVDATTDDGKIAHRELRVRVPDIDLMARPDIRDAWRRPCVGDGGVRMDATLPQDGTSDAATSLDGGSNS